MIIDCISDLHGHYPELEGGDLLIVAGDLTAQDTSKEHLKFVEWLRSQSYKMKIFIGGNHDNVVEKYAISGTSGDSCFYLCDSGTEFEGLKIWGSPWTKTFEGMNPKCKAFTVDTEEKLCKKWELIPKDTDILITHSPPFAVLDLITNGCQVGSSSLMAHHLCGDGFRPRLWVFGHVHEAYGTDGPYRWNTTKYVNASHVNERYQPVNKPVRIDL